MYSQIINNLYNTPKEDLNLDTLTKIKKDRCIANKMDKIPWNASVMREYYRMVAAGEIVANPDIVKVLIKRAVRSQSWIVPVQVLTKPFWCPGKCIFCPNDFTMPKSYINTEPGAQRALMNNFDPYKQAYNRLLSLTMTGHPVDKIEMIVLGGTWDVYPQDYKEWFLKWLYDACNTFGEFLHIYNSGTVQKDFRKFEIWDLDIKYPETIAESIKINETSDQRMIWLTIETRPEYVTDENCIFWRNMWITRIEMWIQSMFDDVLDANKRWHSIEQVREAMHRLRSYAFKISCHFMPGLYWSTITKDIETFRLAYDDIYIRPDEIKFYPTSVIPNTELFDMYVEWKYIPLKLEDSKHIIKETLTKYIPPYTRIKRLIRDIPSEEVAAGSDVTNLRQLVENELMDIYIWDESKRSEQYSKLWSSSDLDNKSEYISDIYIDKKNNLTSSEIGNQFETEDEFFDSSLFTIKSSDIFWKNLLKSTNTYIIWKWKLDSNSVRNFVSLDTRSREITHAPRDHKAKDVFTVIRQYESSNGIEMFISIEDEIGYLYGFGRLCLPKDGGIVNIEWLGVWTAMIRELHVYGQLTGVGLDSNDGVQHTGIGKYILSISEKISSKFEFGRLSVISGIWVREYYKKQGYSLTWTYMVKDLK